MSNGSIKENTQKSLEFIKQYSDKYITLTAIEPDKGIETRTFELSKLSQCKRWIDKYQGTHNIYFSVNPTKYPVNKKANKKDIASMDWLHVDIDPIPDKDLKKERKRILADLKKFKPAPTIIIDSGGGYQGFWKLNPNIKINSIPQATELEGYNKQLEILFDSDHTHNIDRIMRLPGTINVPTKKKKEKGRKPALSKLVEFNDTTYNISEFDKATSRTNTQDLSDIDTGNLPDVDLESLDVTDYIKMIIIHGQDEDEPDKYPSRSEAVFAVTCALKRAEVEDSMIAAILLDKRFKISEHVLEQPHPMKYAERQVLRATEYQSNKFHLTDVGNGRRLSILHGENLRYIHEIKKWMFWDGNLWIIDKNEEIIRLAKDTALNIYHEAMKEQDQERRIKISKWANASEKMDRINAMVKAARSEPDIPISPARLDANPWLIQVSNGVVNLKTGQLIRPERDFYITKQSSVEFQLNAGCPIWEEFLFRIMNGNKLISPKGSRLHSYRDN